MIESRKAHMGQGGFTLIELLVVVAILAILGGAAIIGISTMRENTAETVCHSDQDTLRVAALAWAIENEGGDATTQDLVDDGYLDALPKAHGNLNPAAITVTGGDVDAPTGCD